jgi:hypothetical protein
MYVCMYVCMHATDNVVKYAVNQRFPNWAVPSPGGRWDYIVGRWKWAFPIALFANLRLKWL